MRSAVVGSHRADRQRRAVAEALLDAETVVHPKASI
jgi:hypothetical protein